MTGFTVETRSVTFTEGTSQKIVLLRADHKFIPTVTATLESPDNANYQMYVFDVTRTAVVVRLSAYAHSTVTIKIHAISRT